MSSSLRDEKQKDAIHYTTSHPHYHPRLPSPCLRLTPDYWCGGCRTLGTHPKFAMEQQLSMSVGTSKVRRRIVFGRVPPTASTRLAASSLPAHFHPSAHAHHPSSCTCMSLEFFAPPAAHEDGGGAGRADGGRPASLDSVRGGQREGEREAPGSDQEYDRQACKTTGRGAVVCTGTTLLLLLLRTSAHPHAHTPTATGRAARPDLPCEVVGQANYRLPR